MRRTQVFLLALALACAALTSCERSPTETQRTGSAEITLTTAAGVEQMPRAEAGAYSYNPGPTPETRAMYLSLAGGDTTGVGIEIELFMALPGNQDLPTPGTYVFDPLGSEPVRVAYGSNRVWIGGQMKYYVASGAPSTITIETAAPERVTGHFTMEAAEQHGTGSATVTGVFSAERVTRFEELPRLR